MWSLQVPYVLLLSAVSLTLAGAEEVVILESPNITNWGDWGKPATCTRDWVVTAFRLKMEARDFEIDNTAVNGIHLACGNPNHPEERELGRITSSVSRWGTPTEWKRCKGVGYAVGFALESQPHQGDNGDDVAATNFKIICQDGEELIGYETDDPFPDARFTEVQKCPVHMAICGIQTQVEKEQLWRDDTALNNVRVKCCPVKSLDVDIPIPVDN